MRYVSIALVLVMLAFWLVGAARFIFSSKKNGVRRITTILGGFFIGIGALGFFGTFLISMSDIIPARFELPVGSASGVVTAGDGLNVVPLTAMGRIQVYDHRWKFLHGWPIDAGGGTFNLFVSDTNHIHVVTARLQMHYTYDTNGNLLASEHYPPKSLSTFPQQGRSELVPTSMFLWPLTHPIHSWLTVIFGGALLFISGEIHPRFGRKNSNKE